MGYGYLWSNNTLFEFRNKANNSMFINKLKSINSVEIDYKVSLKTVPKIFKEALIIDLPPLIIESEKYTLQNINQNFLNVFDLSESGKYFISYFFLMKI